MFREFFTRRPRVPDWVADFLNRRTDVERALRAPMKCKMKGQPVPPPLTPEEMWELANHLSIPSYARSKKD